MTAGLIPEPTPAGLIPTVIIGGYLGAGKTTLINEFLRNPLGLRAMVLVNDFGSINIDADLIENQQGETIALTNGCACCSIGDSLLEAAQRVTETHTVPDLVLVEASGVAEPTRMANTLMGVAALAPAHCLVLINGIRAQANARDKYIGRLFRSQIAAASHLAINRLTDAADRNFLLPLLTQHAAQAQQVDSLAAVLADLGPKQGAGSILPPQDTVPPMFCSTVLQVADGLSRDALHLWCKTLPPEVHRAKGILRLDGCMAAVRFDYVQGEIQITPLIQQQHDLEGRIVVIGIGRLDIAAPGCAVPQTS